MGIVSLLEVPAHAGAARSLDNADLRATPVERRTWGFWTFSCFWFAAVSSVSKYDPPLWYSELFVTVITDDPFWTRC